MAVNRRNLMKIAAVGGLAATLPLERSAFTAGRAQRMSEQAKPARFSLPFRRPPEMSPVGMAAVTCQDGMVRSYPRYQITQTFGTAEIMPGFQTPVFGYNGQVPGPVFRVHQGNPIAVDQLNLLHLPPYDGVEVPARYSRDPMQRTTSTHLHGSATMPQFDGYASDITAPGLVKQYFYPNSQEARTLWYHDHGVHHTSQNVYNGLASMYILHDPAEQALSIPQGRYDVPLIITDAMFDDGGQLIYDDHDESGVYGDVLLVNGVPWPEMVVERRKYRFRFLNASVSRSYFWSVSDGRSRVPMTVIGTDGGLMPNPQVVSGFRHGNAERYEVVIDFAQYRDETLLTLENTNPKNNIGYDGVRQAMRFRVRGDATDTTNNRVPSAGQVHPAECMTWTESGLAAQNVPQRRFDFVREHGQWTINGETWADVVDSGYRRCQAEVEQDAIEIWELRNLSGGWFHPTHIHLVDFQMLSRTGGKVKGVQPYERGPKDTVYIGENEKVRLAIRFGGPAAGPGWYRPQGRYMMHCHNLVHEDHDMMMQFNVGDHDYAAELDPITSAPARRVD